MRHKKNKKFPNRGSSHRKALTKNLAKSFFELEKIKTTQAKAKLIKPVIEKIITIGKKNDLHARRKIIRLTGSSKVAEKIIKKISPRYSNRKGGYIKIIKIGPRTGDNATEVHLQLV